MFAKLLSGLLAPSPAPLPPLESRQALAALLVRLARADDAYTGDEITRIDQVLARRYAMSAPQAKALRHDAEALEAEAPDTVRFTKAIKDAVPFEERTGIIEALWQVALADATRDPDEDALIRLVTRLLGISDRDSALARQKIERQP